MMSHPTFLRFPILLILLCLLSTINAFSVLPASVVSTSTRTSAAASASPVVAPPTTILFGKKEARNKGNNSRKTNEPRVRKVKDDVIEIEAIVQESLPNAMFRCVMKQEDDDDTESSSSPTVPPILATISGKIRKNFVKILVGDRVLIELSPYDLTRGRITFRYR